MTTEFNILVVDDDLKNIQVGINFLKKNEDYHLVFATSGEQALERTAEIKFDLILLDIIMPTMDGYEVCKRLKSDEKTKHIPVIFLTAKHEEDSLIKGFEVGGADYITKPFNATELNARVKTHLDLNHYYKQEIAKLQEILTYSQQAETVKYIAGGIAHDCNNFMVSVPGNLFFIENKMREAGIDENEFQDWTSGIRVAVNKVTDLLRQQLSFSSEESQEIKIIDMNDVLADLRKLFNGYSKHKINFEIKILIHPVLAIADKLHVEQVLLNVLINAQHAICSRPVEMMTTEPGKIRLAVDKIEGKDHLKLKPALSYLHITIEDNGCGMPQSVLDKIFDPYFSTRKEDGGTGLGLPVSQGIANSYGGLIEVDSEINKGTCFHVYFPLYDL